MTWAKSYDAESYDEWDNKDDDKWGAQQWGKDRDMYGASSMSKAASDADRDTYGGYGKGQASASQQASIGYGGIGGYGGGYGGYGGYGKGASYGSSAAAGYGKSAGYGMVDAGASAASSQQEGAYDNDEYAKQAYGQDTDSRWGKSYDSVAAQSYDDEQYARKVRADDDQWAEDYDQYRVADTMSRDAAASTEASQPGIKKTTYVPTYNYDGQAHGW
jgi:hypothetical protein